MSRDADDAIDRWLHRQAERDRRQREPEAVAECPRALEAGGFVEHSLSPAATRDFADHVAACPECAEIVASFAAGLEARQDPGTVESPPEEAPPRRRPWVRLLLGGAVLAAASFAAATLYRAGSSRAGAMRVDAELRYVGLLRGAGEHARPDGFQIALSCDREASLSALLWGPDREHGTALLSGYRVTGHQSVVLPAAGRKFPLPEGWTRQRLFVLVTVRTIDPDVFARWVDSLAGREADAASSAVEQFAAEQGAQVIELHWPEAR